MNPSTHSEKKLTLTDWLRLRTKGVIDPIVTVLARIGISPDFLTITGMLSHFLFAWLIAEGRMQLAGIAIAVISPLDALDGALARKLKRTQGNFGAFLDSTMDRLAEIVLYAGYIIYFADQNDLFFVAAAYMALTGSLMVSYARSRAEALNIDCKVGILTRVERYLVIVASLVLNQPEIGIAVLAVFTYITVAQRMYHVWKQTRTPAES